MAAGRTRITFFQLPLVDAQNASARANLPFAAGYLAQALAAAGAAADCVILDQAVAAFGSDAAVLDAMAASRPDILAGTVYLWNVERTLDLAGRLKERLPACRVWLGGPEAQSGARWLADRRVDAWFLGEGEAVFPEAVRAFRDGADGGRLRPGDRVDFAAAASPFATGWLPVGLDGQALVETVRGCRSRCRYCYYGKDRRGLRPAADAALDGFFAWARRAAAKEIYLMDPALDQRPDFPAFLDALAARNPDGIPLHAELRAEAVDADIAARLKAAGTRSVEVGLQSVNKAALKSAGRAFGRRRFLAGAEALRAAGIAIRTGLILGLPDDDPDGFAATLEFVAAAGLAEGAEVYPLAVLPGTGFRENAAAYGLEYLPDPPYAVAAARGWTSAGFYAAGGLAAEILGKDLYPAILPGFPDPVAGLARWARPAQLANPDFRFASSLSLLFDRNDLADAGLLARAAERWRRDDRHGVLQLVVAADGDVDAAAEALSDRFFDPGHYQERLNLYRHDVQGRFSVRAFQLSADPATVRRLMDGAGFAEPIYRLPSGPPAAPPDAELLAEWTPAIGATARGFAAWEGLLARLYAGGAELRIVLPEL